MSQNSFHLVLYHWERALPPATKGQLLGRELEGLQVSREMSLAPSVFPITFEQAMLRLEQSFNAYTEGDGAFGFAGELESGSWRVSGTLFETDGQLGCVDFYINATPTLNVYPAGQLTKLLEVLGTQLSSSIIQLPEHGLHVQGKTFHEFLEQTTLNSWASKFRNAFRGIGIGFRETSFRIHIPAGLAVMLLGWWMRCDITEMSLLCLCVGGVWTAELLNTAIEHLSRAVTQKDDVNIGRALDTAAGAVLVASLAAASVGIVVLSGRLMEQLR